MKKNLKQPVYDRANLIDFTRRNVWMGQVEKHGLSGLSLRSAAIVLILAIVFVAVKIWI